MKKITLYSGIVLSTLIFISACQQQITAENESSPQEVTTVIESSQVSPIENTVQETLAEYQPITVDAEIQYTFSDIAKKQLTRILTDAFFFDIGHDREQKFSELTFENSNLEILLYTTLFDGEGARYDQNEPRRIHVSKEEVKTYLQDCFGINLDSLNADNSFLEEDGSDYAIVANDPFGSDIPDCRINTITQNTETDIVTLTGDAWIVSDSYPTEYYTFTTTMLPTNSSYFDGHTLLTFEWHENPTDNHPTIDYTKYGYWEGYNPETIAAQ